MQLSQKIARYYNTVEIIYSRNYIDTYRNHDCVDYLIGVCACRCGVSAVVRASLGITCLASIAVIVELGRSAP